MADFTFTTYTEHQVATGETLDQLAKQAGLTWRHLAMFNWGIVEPDKINRCLHEFVGCQHHTSDGKNFKFTSQDDPGVIFIPVKLPTYTMATDKAYVVQVKRPRMYSRVELQSVDEFGYSVKDTSLVLTSLDGNPPVEVTTDENGYAKLRKIPAGRYRVTLKSGEPAYFLGGMDKLTDEAPDAAGFGNFDEAVIHTKNNVTAVTRVVVKRDASPEARRKLRRNMEIYGRNGDRNEQTNARGTETRGTTHLSNRMCVDNLLLAAGWVASGASSDTTDTLTPNLEKLFKDILEPYLRARLPTAIARGYYVMMLKIEDDPKSGRPTGRAKLTFVDPNYSLGAQFDLSKAWCSSGIGFYTTYEVRQGFQMFTDLETHTYGPAVLDDPQAAHATGQEDSEASAAAGAEADDHTMHVDNPVAGNKKLYLLDDHVDDRERFVAEKNARAGKVMLLLWLRSDKAVFKSAVMGGMGRLEDSDPDTTEKWIMDGIHERNLLVASHISLAYRAYANGYCARLEKIRDDVSSELQAEKSYKILAEFERRVRELGPPPSVYEMPRPVYATDAQYRELLDAYSDTNELAPWRKLVQILDGLASVKSAGYPFLRIKPKWNSTEYTKTAGELQKKVRPGLSRLLDAHPVGVEVEGNLEVQVLDGEIRVLKESTVKWIVTIDIDGEAVEALGGDAAVGAGALAGKGASQTVHGFFKKIAQYAPIELEAKGKVETIEPPEDGQPAEEDDGEGVRVLNLRFEEAEEYTVYVAKVFEIEASSNGNLKFTLEPFPEAPLMVQAQGNPLNGEIAAGIKLSGELLARSLESWASKFKGKLSSPEYLAKWPRVKKYLHKHEGRIEDAAESLAFWLKQFELEIEVGFVGTDEETLLAIASMAPGFFERHGEDELFDPKMLWNQLTMDEQVSLGNLHWDQGRWDGKYKDRQLVPQEVRKSRAALLPPERVAIVHLGFRTYGAYREAVERHVGLPKEERETAVEGSATEGASAGGETRTE